VPPENLHATVVFLGDVSDGDTDDLTAALGEVATAAAPIPLEITHAHTAPERRPRMVWASLAASEPLRALSAGLAAAAAPFAPGIRPALGGSGHITMARFRTPRPRLSLDPLELEHPSFKLGHVSLVHSTLGRGGAVYSTLAELPLGSRQGG
jgi:2'-5' RNA ligase